jgi:pyrroloquinoline-quinone synthase
MREVIAGGEGTTGLPAGLTPEAARRYHGTFLKYMSFFAWKFPSWLMSVASLCPYQDVRKLAIGDCSDEEVGDPEADDMAHIDLLYEEAEECGISREEIFNTEPTAPILTAIHAWENLTRTLGWLPGFAAIGGLEILQSEPAIRARQRLLGPEATDLAKDLGGSSFHEKLGLPDGSLKFLAHHSYKDQFHGGGELSIIVKYATTPQLQQECLWAVRASRQIASVHWSEVRRLAAVAAGVQVGSSS